MPLMARPPFTAGWLIAIAVRWPPADQPETKSCFGSPPSIGMLSREPAARGMDLGDDAVEALLRREGVADERDVDSPGERPFGDEGEQLLRAVLPVAAVDEHEHRAVAPRGEVVDAVALVLAVAQVHAFGCAARSRALRASQSATICALSLTAAPLLYAASSAARSIPR